MQDFNSWECSHPQRALRFRRRKNDLIVCVEQCLQCGGELRAVGKRSPEYQALTEQVPFDEVLPERVAAERRARGEQERLAYLERLEQDRAARQQATAEQNAAWWQRYNQYLQSPAWKDRRRRVLERDGHLCQACRKRPATQVHHLTYAHVGNEPLFDLVSVCDICHAALHQPAQEQEQAA